MVVASLGMSKERVTARLQDEALFTFVCRVSIDSPGLVVISSRVRSRPPIVRRTLLVLVLSLWALQFMSSGALQRAYLAWLAAISHVQPTCSVSEKQIPAAEATAWLIARSDTSVATVQVQQSQPGAENGVLHARLSPTDLASDRGQCLLNALRTAEHCLDTATGRTAAG